MNDDEVMELAQRAGTYTEVEDGEEWLVMSESAFPVFAKLIIEAEREKCQARITDLYRQLDEAEKQLDQQYKLGMEAEREACAQLCESRFMGDLNREDMEARRLAAAIRERGEK